MRIKWERGIVWKEEGNRGHFRNIWERAKETERDRERERGRQTDKQTDRDRETVRQRQTDRQTGSQTDEDKVGDRDSIV